MFRGGFAWLNAVQNMSGERQWKRKEIASISKYWSEMSRRSPGKKESLDSLYEGWFPPILTFKFCYAILLWCYSVFLGILLCSFESYYSLSNSVIHFSDFIMPLWILLFSFQFCYSLSNFVMQFSNPVIRSGTVLSCSFESYYFLLNSVVLFSNSIMPLWIVLFSFQFYYSLSNYVLRNPGLRLFGRRYPGDQ